MSQNEALYLLRKNKGIGLKEAARGSHVPFLLLYLYERGYLRLRAKDERLLASFYGVETSYFKDRAGYPTPIFTKTGPSKFMSALYTFGATWRAFAVSTILFVSCLGLVASGGAIAYKTNNKASSYYDADYLSLVGNVIEKGDPVLFVEEVRSIEYDKDDDNTISLMVTTLQRQVGDLTYTVHLVSDSANYEIQFKETTSALSLDFARSESGTYLSQGKANLTAGKYLISELKDGTGGAVEESVWASEQAKLDSCPSLVNGLFEGLRSDSALTTKLSLDELLLLQGQGNEKLSADVSLGDNLLLLPSLFAALFFCLSALIVWGLIHKRRHAEVPVAYVEAPEKTLEPIIRSRPSAYRDLRGNWSFGPFIPETLLRLGAIAIVLASSIMLFHICHTVLASGDLMAIASLIGDAEKWYKFMPLVSMACLLWFFVRLEIMPSERYNLLPAIIMFFFGGCVYYVAENMLAFYLSDTGNYYYNLLFIGLTYILPGNLFWGIGCFALIDLFLLTTPSFVTNKKRTAIWRCMALLPIVYLLLSYFYQVGTSLWGWAKWPSYLANLLYRKQFPTMVFSIFFPVSVYLCRLVAVRRLGMEKATLYFHGNEYFFLKNLIAAFWIALIVVLNFSFAGTAYAKAIGVTSKSYWMALLIPFVLLYHPHMGDRNPIFDNVITALYIVSMSFAYVYVGYYLLFEFPRMFNLV